MPQKPEKSGRAASQRPRIIPPSDPRRKKSFSSLKRNCLWDWLCLINFGYVTLALKTDTPPADTQQVIENLSGKIGIVLLVLGGMHFLNLFVFSKLRKRGQEPQMPPPFPPTDYTLPPVPQE